MIDPNALTAWINRLEAEFSDDTAFAVFADWLEEQDPHSQLPARIREHVAEFRAAWEVVKEKGWRGKPSTRAHNAVAARDRLMKRQLPELLKRVTDGLMAARTAAEGVSSSAAAGSRRAGTRRRPSAARG